MAESENVTSLILHLKALSPILKPLSVSLHEVFLELIRTTQNLLLRLPKSMMRNFIRKLTVHCYLHCNWYSTNNLLVIR